jgi:subtilisin family serine protease
MRAHRNGIFCIAAVAALSLAAVDAAFAQRVFSRGPSSNIGTVRGGGGYYGGGNRGRSYTSGYYAQPLSGVSPGIVQDIEGGDIDDSPQGPRRPRRTARSSSGAPSANERRLVPDEVVISVADSVSAQQIDALQRRHRLTRIESQTFQLTGTTLFRWRIPDRRSVAAVVRALEADRLVASAQPNYLFALQLETAKAATEGDAAQYELAKLRLPQAHSLTKGDKVPVAVIDSGVDANHPELAGTVAETYDTLTAPITPHKHGTAIAGLIAAHGKLMGAAPGARILAIRAFAGTGASAEGTTFNILKGLDWAAAKGARVINMSFAGPPDPALHRGLEAAHKKGIVLVAAAGNAGPKSPPLYPAADPNVIAVTATDADDGLFPRSNRGRYIAVAAPGVQILVAIPDEKYEVASGTSYAAAEVSGIIALMIERKGDLTPDKARDVLLATARDLGPKGRDIMFGAGLVDAYGALMAEVAPVTVAAPAPIERASTGAR